MQEQFDSYASPRKPSGAAARSLEKRFAAQVSMTPPANIGAMHAQHSPFSSWNQRIPVQPATESRQSFTGTIPRSHAFASLAPLTKSSHASQMPSSDGDAETASEPCFPHAVGGGIKRTVPLHHVSHFGGSDALRDAGAGNGESSSIASSSLLWHHRNPSDSSVSGSSAASIVNGIEHAAHAGPSSQPMLRAGSRESQAGGFDMYGQRSRPAGFRPSAALNDDDYDMDMGSDDDEDDELNMLQGGRPSLSPTPFGGEQLECGGHGPSELTDLGGPMLQPGVRVPLRTGRKASSSAASSSSGLGSVASSNSHYQQQRGSFNSASGASGLFLHTPARRRCSTSGSEQPNGLGFGFHMLNASEEDLFGRDSIAPAQTQPDARSRAQRARASSSAALHRPLTEFLTPRSTSASAMLGEKLPGVANLFEFATQPRPIIRSSDHDPDTTPLREAKRRSVGTSLGTFPSGKLFEDEIEAAKSSRQDLTSSTNAGGPKHHRKASSHSSSVSAEQPGLLEASTPARRPPCRSRFGHIHGADSFGYHDSDPDTPQRLFGGPHSFSAADDSGVAFGDAEGSAKSTLKRTPFLGAHLTQPGASAFTSVHRVELDNVLASPVRGGETTMSRPCTTPIRRENEFATTDSPARRPAAFIGVAHAFGPKERSSLAREARFAQSSPDPAPRARSRTSTASPARKIRERRPTSEAAEGSGHHYLTPQNFKSVKPLQAAFMSTGLVSKRSRARENSAGGESVETFPVPPKPNFGHALGLREVVAAASAHAAAGADRSNHAMPDTPVKKPAVTSMVPFPRAGAGPGSAVRSHLGSVSLLGPSPLGVYSPAKESVSSNTSADSPLLAGGCDSPTLNLMSLSPPNASTPATGAPAAVSAFAAPPSSVAGWGPSRFGGDHDHSRFQPFVHGDSIEDDGNVSDNACSPSLQSGRVRDALRLQKGKRPSTKGSSSSDSAPRKILSVNTTKAMAVPSKSLRVRSSGLGRKAMSRNNSFAAASQANGDHDATASVDAFAPSTPVTTTTTLVVHRDESVPMTPTRNAAQIKWFEAAQVLTTPSPSSRRQAAQKLRAHRLELMQTRCKSRLSETSTCSETPMKGMGAVVPSTPSSRIESSHGIVSHPASDLGVVSGPSRLETVFAVEETIGSGEFSEVIKVTSKSTGYAYAVKRMKRAYGGPKDRLRRLEEVDVLRQLSTSGKPHSNIVSLFDAWEEEGHLYLQLELCPLGSLAFFLEEYGQQVGPLDEPRLWKVLAELSSGLAHIHGNGILHLDLKPANVLITEYGSLKIGDFGMATRWPPGDAESVLRGAGLANADVAMSPESRSESAAAPRRGLEREGDREYLAPEVIFHGQYGKAADIFSLGLILLEAAGNVELPDNGEPWQKLRRDDFSDVDLGMLSGTMLRVLERLLCSDPEGRPTIEEVMAMPTLQTVRSIMSRGLSASEMDQLPEFNESSTTSGSLHALTESASNQSMQSDSSYRNTALSFSDGDSSMPELSESGSALGLSGIPSSLSGQTSISTSASSYGSHQVLREPEEEFLREVIGSDPAEQQMDAYTNASAGEAFRARSVSPTSDDADTRSSVRHPFASVQPIDVGAYTAPMNKLTREAFTAMADVDAMDLDA
ncbi:hypothetical protein BCV70DRAFT_212036 [Testicularia cyperi]|uniref:Protein kinase domain-containing protein n=1 Tax=Testicularia cyperi TaxID=1882483 RepID=A0A317XNB3_9BASI|nr:hypothetical protein BCV70DRAFT_212036 [Testicularia cyperi]